MWPDPWGSRDDPCRHLEPRAPGGRRVVNIADDAPLTVHEMAVVAAWYVNLQEPLRRTADGFETLDHVLDILVAPDLRISAGQQRVRAHGPTRAETVGTPQQPR